MMNPTSPRLPPAQALAESFATQAARWAQARGAPETAIRLARQSAFLLSMAVAAGNVCLTLDDIAAALERAFDADSLRKWLLASGIVGTPEACDTMPLILDSGGRLYLHRYFDYECRLARDLTRRLESQDATVGEDVKTRLNALFAANQPDDGIDWQKVAAAMALLGRLTLISGGPGTGKTTTVVNLLACLLEQNPDCRVALAAPTGKAAARMTEAIRLRAGHLPAALRARLPATAFTLHRLLGVTPTTGEFRHHADNPLPIDALIVDEASMLDLALATRLFEAVPEHARIILLGDKDQLAAVESGAVFSELGADPSLSAPRRAALAQLCELRPEALDATVTTTGAGAGIGLRDCVVWLTRNFRFARDSGIGQLAREINGGDAAAAIARLRANTDAALGWIEEDAERPSEAAVRSLFTGYADYLEVMRHAAHDRAAVFQAFGRFRALCAVHAGPRGVEAINALVGGHFRAALAHPLDRDERSDWYPGRPLMVLRNDYVLKLFNGDIGIVLPDASGELMAYFPDQEASFRSVAPVRLPEHATAFAMTVHKSQGSEFDEVLVMLPSAPSPVLTRELIYTAITRARARMTLVGDAAVLGKSIQTATRRHSGLAARFRE
jgi:exodeoxyribonuclease V alpha subunit